MSRISHLPLRCPLTRVKENETHNLIRFPSLDTILEEQPSWFDDLLNDSDVNPKGNVLRRSASDPSAILEVSDNLQSPISNIDVTKSVGIGEGSEICNGLEGNCVYGPNSPRQKSNLTNLEVSALMETIPPNKLQYVTVDLPNRCATKQGVVHRDFQIVTSALDPEKVLRRRSGQRSRVRKLQYIAELERTVEAYQTWVAGLAAGVASLFQQHVALSAENKNLRRQISGLRQEKMIKDVPHGELNQVELFYSEDIALSTFAGPISPHPTGNPHDTVRYIILNSDEVYKESSDATVLHNGCIKLVGKLAMKGQYQALKNEAERLKVIYGHRHHHRRSKSISETDLYGASWQMLDLGKLSLSANPVPLRQGLSFTEG